MDCYAKEKTSYRPFFLQLYRRWFTCHSSVVVKCLAEASVVQNTRIKVETAGSWQYDGPPLWGSWLWSSGAEREGTGLNGKSVRQARKLNTRSRFFRLACDHSCTFIPHRCSRFSSSVSLCPFSSFYGIVIGTSNEPHWFIFTITMVTFVPYSLPLIMHPNWTQHAEPVCRQREAVHWLYWCTQKPSTAGIYSYALVLHQHFAQLVSRSVQWSCTALLLDNTGA